MGGKLGKSEKSCQAGVGFVEFLQCCGGALKSQMGQKRTPMALFRVGQGVLLLPPASYPVPVSPLPRQRNHGSAGGIRQRRVFYFIAAGQRKPKSQRKIFNRSATIKESSLPLPKKNTKKGRGRGRETNSIAWSSVATRHI